MQLKSEEKNNFFNWSTQDLQAEHNSNYLHAPTDILNALVKSKEESTSIGILSTVLGSEVIITGIENIIFKEDQTIIVLRPYDSTGYILPYTRINVMEIQAVWPFTTPFGNPYIAAIGKDKTWYF